MDTRLTTISKDSLASITNELTRNRRKPLPGLNTYKDQVPASKQVRVAKTTINSFAYPAAGSNKFEIELGYLDFDETTVGLESLTFTSFYPQEFRIAASLSGYLPQNTVVNAILQDGRWLITTSEITPAAGFIAYIMELTSGWTSNEATGDLYEMDNATDTGLDGTLLDNLLVLSDLGIGDRAYVYYQDGYYHPINAPCPP